MTANSCDTTVGGASGEDKKETLAFQVFLPLPSIVVDPTDGEEVESGELRWPPDDVSSDVREVTGVPAEGAEPQEKVMGGV